MNQFTTVAGVFRHSVQSFPDQLAVRVISRDGSVTELANRHLWDLSCAAAAAYRSFGLVSGDRVVLATGTSADFFPAYLGAWFARMIPVVVQPLKDCQQEADHHRLVKWAQRAGAEAIIVAESLSDFRSETKWWPTSALKVAGSAEPFDPLPEEPAHFQATSGTTAFPKLAIVEHGQIAANVKGIGQAIHHRPDDSVLSWLPLWHDMGLIGFSYALGWRCPITFAETSCFIQNPFTWLYYLSNYGATLSPAPNAAFSACARLAKRRAPDPIDLSHWRVALCGSEPVHPATLKAFEESFAAYGYRATTTMPVYGLAEATLAVTIPAPGTGLETIHLDRRSLECDGLCRHLDDADEAPSIELVSVGRAISGLEVRIAGAKEASGVGEVQVKGNSVIGGYWNDEGATNQLKTPDGFLRTGDLGFIFGGNLFIAGRTKDIIVIGGRNFLPQELERAAMLAAEAYSVGTIVAVGIYNERAGTECLHLLIEERRSVDSTTRLELENRIRSSLADRQGITGIYIHWAARGSIPHTSSGKIQRFLCREIINGAAA